VAVAFAATPGADAFAGPPPWAPAHGWRAKHDHKPKRHRDSRVPFVYPKTVVQQPPVIVTRGANFACDRSLLTGNMTLLAQLLGGAGGAVAGAQFGKGNGQLAATAGGALLGLLVGTGVGASLDAADAACAQQALETLDTGRAVAWRNPDAGTHYTMVPTRTYQASGTYCREYTTRAAVGSRSQEVYGTACRLPDGSWRIVQ
jgi:surface antigen